MINLSLFILFISYNSVAQVSLISNVNKINSGNSFTIISNNSSHTVVLKDTKLYENSQNNENAIKYLTEKILSKEVVITEITEQKDLIVGNVIYNCVKNNLSDDIPCSEGHILNVEMFKQKLIQYTGTNKFLKSISDR